MDPRENTYAPGAGTPPPELAGRDAVLAVGRLAIQRNRSGRSARSFMFVGLRGVGKTVLLNEVQAMAEEEGALTDFIEAANKEPLSVTMIATLRSVLLKLDRIKGVSRHVKKSQRVLKSFVGAVKVTVERVEFAIDIDGEPDVADSGTLSRDSIALQGPNALDRLPLDAPAPGRQLETPLLPHGPDCVRSAITVSGGPWPRPYWERTPDPGIEIHP